MAFGFRTSAQASTVLRRCANLANVTSKTSHQTTALLSTTSNRLSMIQIAKDESTKIATLTMNHKPVNALGISFMDEFMAELDGLVKDDGVHGVIITSSAKNVFCGGLDFGDMATQDKGKLADFWRRVQNLWLKLYTLPMPAVANINGHSPAGGVLIAGSCDYRIMLDGKYGVGLNEVKIGLVAPFFLADTLRCLTGQRVSEYALISGKLYNPQEAKTLGIVDELVPSVDEGAARAEVVLKEFLKGSDKLAVANSKLQMRREVIEKFHRLQQEDLDFFVSEVSSPRLQAVMGAYIASLKKK